MTLENRRNPAVGDDPGHNRVHGFVEHVNHLLLNRPRPRWCTSPGPILDCLGVLDLLNLPPAYCRVGTGRLHAILNSTALVIFLVDFIWRSNTRDSWDSAPVGPLVLSIIGLAVIGVSGFLGGKLAYRYGVRVADESVQAKGFRTSAKQISSS